MSKEMKEKANEAFWRKYGAKFSPKQLEGFQKLTEGVYWLYFYGMAYIIKEVNGEIVPYRRWA